MVSDPLGRREGTDAVIDHLTQDVGDVPGLLVEGMGHAGGEAALGKAHEKAVWETVAVQITGSASFCHAWRESRARLESDQTG